MKDLVDSISQVSKDPKAYPLYHIIDLLTQAGQTIVDNAEGAERINRHIDAIEESYHNVIKLIMESYDKELKELDGVMQMSLSAIKDMLEEYVLLDLPYGSKAYAKANITKQMLEDLLKK